MHKIATGRMLAQENSKLDEATALVYITLETLICVNHTVMVAFYYALKQFDESMES